MLVTLAFRLISLAIFLGAYALVAVLLFRHDFKAAPVLSSGFLVMLWLFEGFALRVLMQAMDPMLISNGVGGFAIECVLWPSTLWRFWGVA